ncbi:MAG TPA: hypothetical protein VHV10_16425 [Ktedonobacteraceae bacterium]|jgi:hypothetical protein|nr:hypothetical protein [Ktedonobacteraceae bacterium]
MTKKDDDTQQPNPPLGGTDQAPTPSAEGEEQPQNTAGFQVGEFGEHPTTSDHRTLVDALKEAFTKDMGPIIPKIGMDETIPNGKYIVRGQLVNAHGEPIDEKGNKLKKD